MPATTATAKPIVPSNNLAEMILPERETDMVNRFKISVILPPSSPAWRGRWLLRKPLKKPG
jgi:hypothetical protein